MTALVPYRDHALVNHNPVIEEQMKAAVAFLLQWKRWQPAIAGGALWAWSAGQPARDVDIFAKSTFWSRRRAKKVHGNPELQEMYDGFTPDGMYSYATTHYMVARRYLVQTVNGTNIDFILSSYTGLKVIKRFDYKHCAVAWGLNGFSTHGATAYAEAELVAQYHKDSSWAPRNKEAMLAKKQNCLWGNKYAPDALMATMRKLAYLHKLAESEKEPGWQERLERSGSLWET